MEWRRFVYVAFFIGVAVGTVSGVFHNPYVTFAVFTPPWIGVWIAANVKHHRHVAEREKEVGND